MRPEKGMNAEGQRDASKAAACRRVFVRPRTAAVSRLCRTSCVLLAFAAGALACAPPVLARPLDPRTAPRHSPPTLTARAARKHKHGCPRGHVLLALHGPRTVVTPRAQA